MSSGKNVDDLINANRSAIVDVHHCQTRLSLGSHRAS